MVTNIEQQFFARFIQFISTHLLSIDEIETVKLKNYFWSSDYWLIEICKYLYLTKTTYINDALPRRFIGNPFFKKDQICEEAETKISTLIHLKYFAKQDQKYNVHIYNAKRGLDVLLVYLAEISQKHNSFLNIYCYDKNEKYKTLIREFIYRECDPEFGKNITFSVDLNYDFKNISEPSILIFNKNSLTDTSFNNIENIIDNANVQIIRNGCLVSNIKEFNECQITNTLDVEN